jgi:hypothetical protein
MTITRHTKLSELQAMLALARQGQPPSDRIPQRMISSIQQSLEVEGYAVSRRTIAVVAAETLQKRLPR